MQSQTNYTGIDISKLFFDVAVPDGEKYHYYKFSNDLAGFETLVKVLEGQSHIIMEASGPYYLRLACYLHSKCMNVSVVNPLVIRRFCQMRMSRAKTDKKDAMMIAEYGKAEKTCFMATTAAAYNYFTANGGLIIQSEQRAYCVNKSNGEFR